MSIIGCDFHSRFWQIAMLDTQTGGVIERRLEHETGEARSFTQHSKLRCVWGWEATGYAQWFERMLPEQGHELWAGLVMLRRFAQGWFGSRRQTPAMLCIPHIAV